MLSDRAKVIALGVGNGVVGFLSRCGRFLPGTTFALSNGTHDLQLRKYAADTAVFFVDGARRAGVPYAALSSDTFSPELSPVAFGGLPMSSGSNSTWESVINEIGVASPEPSAAYFAQHRSSSLRRGNRSPPAEPARSDLRLSPNR